MFSQLAGVDETSFAEETVSVDQNILVVVFGTGLSSFTVRLQDIDTTDGRSLMYVFANGSVEPRFMTTNESYVYGTPAFSPNGQYLAFAYAHNWRPYPDSPDPSDPYVEWDDTIAVIDTQTWVSREILTNPSGPGYGRWADPKQFATIEFVNNHTLFAHDWTYRGGPSQAWNIPLDGSEPITVDNPFF